MKKSIILGLGMVIGLGTGMAIKEVVSIKERITLKDLLYLEEELKGTMDLIVATGRSFSESRGVDLALRTNVHKEVLKDYSVIRNTMYEIFQHGLIRGYTKEKNKEVKELKIKYADFYNVRVSFMDKAKQEMEQM